MNDTFGDTFGNLFHKKKGVTVSDTKCLRRDQGDGSMGPKMSRYIHIPELQHGHFGVSDGERGLPTKNPALGDWAVCKVRMKWEKQKKHHSYGML